jgi:hypothetical protein
MRAENVRSSAARVSGSSGSDATGKVFGASPVHGRGDDVIKISGAPNEANG